MKRAMILILIITTGFMSCKTGPQEIKLGKDACSFCKMTITDHNFGAELVNRNGKVYKFDDTHCLAAFRAENAKEADNSKIYVVNFLDTHELIEADKAYFLYSPVLHSPMGGNTAAFENEDVLKLTQQKTNGQVIKLADVLASK